MSYPILSLADQARITRGAYRVWNKSCVIGRKYREYVGHCIQAGLRALSTPPGYRP